MIYAHVCEGAFDTFFYLNDSSNANDCCMLSYLLYANLIYYILIHANIKRREVVKYWTGKIQVLCLLVIIYANVYK